MGESHAEFAERTVDILESKIDSLQETLYKEKLNYRLWQQYFLYFVILSFFRAISEQLDKTLKMMMDMWLFFFVSVQRQSDTKIQMSKRKRQKIKHPLPGRK